MAVEQMKNGKAPGIDNISPELLKEKPDLTVENLEPFLTMIWKEEQVPEEWKKGVIHLPKKKGFLFDCNKWGGITLLST